ncbi:MAG TPA: beta-galactosidase [Verrucomicrobiae bacterium]|nr:beta-galactosidase [Verrucomicrobiae bacterium]
MKLPLALASALAAIVGFGSASASEKFFPQRDLMQIGVYYYPEAWPSNQWARDISNMKKLNLEFVHMGEFAWAFMEPAEGKFDFDWLERNVQLCAEQGLKVILCTPSPAPPVWLSEAHPEILLIDAKGRRMQHGTRQHACWSVPKYREYVGKIVDELGKRFGNDARVWGWQLDNELSHYGKEPCFCDACQTKFRAWLKNKYGTIENLNRDWGNAFWSQLYQNFDQIRIPNKDEFVAQWNEHSVLDSQRWFAEEAADYLRFQTSILRKHCGDRQWVTHNFMQGFDRVYPILNARDFEIVTWTIYPAHGNLNEGPLGFRLGGAAQMSFAHDFFRSINGFQGIMELQPGQVNWGEVNPQPYPGAIHMWLMRAFAAGSKIVCTYRYRQPLFGAEQYHYGIVGTDGVTASTGGEQYSQAAKEIALLRENLKPDAKEPPAYSARRTALLYNFENRWDIDNHKQNIRWDTMGHLFKHYRALKRVGAPVDVITEDKDFQKYPFLIAPAYQLADSNLVRRLAAYAEKGGHLVLSCRTGIKDRRGHLWEGPWAMPILELIGAKIKFYDTLPAPNSAKVKAGRQTYDWVTWGEVLEPGPDATVLATHADQYYAGGAAAVTRKLGRGSVTYIGVDSQDGGFEAQLIRGVFDRARVETENLPENFLVDWRDGFWIATNFTEKSQRAPVPRDAKILVGTAEVPVAGVTVWQE